MTSHNVAIWIDHQEAKIFHIAEEGFDEAAVHAPAKHLHRHPQHTAEHAHPLDLQQFFDQTLQAAADAQQILIVGPGSAKLELIKHVHKHRPAFESKIVGVETVDHPSDGQLAAHARKYFLGSDRVR